MKRDDILNAALLEFSKRDYDRASINSIIQMAKASKGTFYHYFSNKKALYLELIQRASDEKINHLKEERRLADTTHPGSLFARMNEQMAKSVHFGLQNPDLAAFAVMAANEPNSSIREEAQAVIGTSTRAYLESLIGDEIAAGRIRGDLPEEFTLAICSYLVTRFNDFLAKAGIGIHRGNEEQIMDYLAHYLDFMENGLGGTASNTGD